MIKPCDPSRYLFPRRGTSHVRTDVTNAIMTGADLRGVDLRRVRGLTCRQVRSARIDARTQLPLRLRLLCVWDRWTSQLASRDEHGAECHR